LRTSPSGGCCAPCTLRAIPGCEARFAFEDSPRPPEDGASPTSLICCLHGSATTTPSTTTAAPHHRRPHTTITL
jgi:hypothetical protein